MVRVNVVKVLRLVEPLCALLLRLSRWIVRKDWIATGSFSHISPMVGTSAQNSHPSGHPIVRVKHAAKSVHR